MCFTKSGITKISHGHDVHHDKTIRGTQYAIPCTPPPSSGSTLVGHINPFPPPPLPAPQLQPPLPHHLTISFCRRPITPATPCRPTLPSSHFRSPRILTLAPQTDCSQTDCCISTGSTLRSGMKQSNASPSLTPLTRLVPAMVNPNQL